MDFFINSSDLADANSYKEEYQKGIKNINERKIECELALEQMDKKQKIFKIGAMDLDSLMEKIRNQKRLSMLFEFYPVRLDG